MVSDDTLLIVNATAPVLAEHGEALTRHFYQRMFAENPEVKPFFNPAHQAAGTQQRALAAAITSYATYLGTPEKLGDAVRLIAHKHASLGVRPEHYPIVGKHLLASIQEVLGIPADDPIVNAWAEAYQALADLLIESEESIYSTLDQGHTGRTFTPFVVDRKVPESAVITSFYLKPQDSQPLGAFAAGQFLTVRIPGRETATTMRNYSLSGTPDTSCYRISVKREAPDGSPPGHASHYLHDTIKEGDTLDICGPFGTFTLQGASPERPLLLMSAGVGITPLLAMLHQATADTDSDRPIVFLHATQNNTTHAFRHEVDAVAAQNPAVKVHYCYDNPLPGDEALVSTIGRIDDVPLASLLPSTNVDAYYCGPLPFMAQVRERLIALGVKPENHYYECFGPSEELSAN